MRERERYRKLINRETCGRAYVCIRVCMRLERRKRYRRGVASDSARYRFLSRKRIEEQLNDRIRSLAYMYIQYYIYTHRIL